MTSESGGPETSRQFSQTHRSCFRGFDVRAAEPGDQLLYQADNSVVNTSLLVKEYVKGAFGT